MKLKESLVSRRNFIDNCLIATGAVVGGSATYILFTAISPVMEPDDPLNIILNKAEIWPTLNSAKIFYFGRIPSLLIRSERDELIALCAVCTHFECLVHYHPGLKKLICPCHQGWFDIYGHPIQGPPSKPLMRYQIHTEQDYLIISREFKSATAT